MQNNYILKMRLFFKKSKAWFKNLILDKITQQGFKIVFNN